MSDLEIRRRPSGPDSCHLELYLGSTHIGDYERSKESEIPRKLWEIQRTTNFLLEAYAEHGKFVVRWNGRIRGKEIRKYQDGFPDPGRGAQPLGVIPEECWKGYRGQRPPDVNQAVPGTSSNKPEIVGSGDLRAQPHHGKEGPVEGAAGGVVPRPRRRAAQDPDGGREPEGGWHGTEERRKRIEALLNRDAVKDEINHMSGEQFEQFMAELFRQKGYSVQRTPGSGDHGVDLLLEVENLKVAVELKRWVAPVGNRVISHALGGMLHYGAREAWVVTTGSFTPKAKEMARSTGVRLVDGVQLAEWLEGLRDE